jgi:hypothetical protein
MTRHCLSVICVRNSQSFTEFPVDGSTRCFLPQCICLRESRRSVAMNPQNALCADWFVETKSDTRPKAFQNMSENATIKINSLRRPKYFAQERYKVSMCI